ncbi:MAG: glycosyl hydrolase-related protein [Promethearchaeati archaeon SRVP18_Atabeyarchaeia-1]
MSEGLDQKTKKGKASEREGYSTVYFVNHSHMDNSWGGTPRDCLEKNLAIIEEVVKSCELFPDFYFSMENVYPLQEFARRYPEQLNRIDKLIKGGKLEVGGAYVHPTVDYCFDELIARNFSLGKAWLKQTFSYDTKVVLEEDTPGHTLQTPQLLKRAGVRYYKISRGPPSIFYWVSPDGSAVLTYLAEYSWSHHSLLGYSSEETVKRLPGEIEKARSNYRITNLMIPDGDDWTSPNLTLLEIIRTWNETKGKPLLKLGTVTEFLSSVEREQSIPVVTGDMPNLWVGVAAVQADTIRRLRRIQNIIFSAEEFMAISSLLGSDHNYKDIQDAWRLALLVADHNWGGKEPGEYGEFCDEEKARYVKQAATLCMKQLEKALESITSRVDTTSSDKDEVPLIVFNQLPWKRSDLVEFEVDTGADPMKIQIRSQDGTYIPSQASIITSDDERRKIHVAFVADEVPPAGYKTYFIDFNGSSEKVESLLNAERNVIENRFYRVEIDPRGRGIARFLDKERGVEIGGERECSLGPLRFSFILNELFGMGLRLNVRKIPTVLDRTNDLITVVPTGEFFRAGDFPCNITVIENGPVKATILIEGKFIDSVKRQEITLYDKLNRVDLKTSIDWSGKNFVALMLTFPLNLESSSNTVVNVPYGAVNLTDVAPGFWVKPSDPIQFKVRGVQHWIDNADSGGGAMLSTNWPCFDFTMTTSAVVLWAMDSENSFFSGQRYRQKGIHTLVFSLMPHQGGWRMAQAYKNGLSTTFPLIPVMTSQHSAFLPREMSFMKIEGSNIVVTALKKADDDRGYILRVYEAEGKERSFTIEFYRDVKECWETNLLEEDVKGLTFYKKQVDLRISPYEIKTIRILFKESGGTTVQQ